MRGPCICKDPFHVHGHGLTCHDASEPKSCPKETFQKTWTHYSLNQNVLCVAVSDHGEWAAYIGAVPGKNHTEEAEEVSIHGSKLPHLFASNLFPSMERAYRWRL